MGSMNQGRSGEVVQWHTESIVQHKMSAIIRRVINYSHEWCPWMKRFGRVARIMLLRELSSDPLLAYESHRTSYDIGRFFFFSLHAFPSPYMMHIFLLHIAVSVSSPALSSGLVGFPSCLRSSSIHSPCHIRSQQFPQYVFAISPHHICIFSR